tara:strand:+ start:251 stop:502 length:252 start_codon:yes stop_codon:yes gene_type:complete
MDKDIVRLFKYNYMDLPVEIISRIFMYAVRSIHHDHPCFQQELESELANRHTYAHRVRRCKKVARLYMKKYKIEKLKYYGIIH